MKTPLQRHQIVRRAHSLKVSAIFAPSLIIRLNRNCLCHLRHPPRRLRLFSSHTHTTGRTAFSRPSTTNPSSLRGLPAKSRSATLRSTKKISPTSARCKRRLLPALRFPSIRLPPHVGSPPSSFGHPPPPTLLPPILHATSASAAYRRRPYATRPSMHVSAPLPPLRPPFASLAEGRIAGKGQSAAANAAATCTPVPAPASRAFNRPCTYPTPVVAAARRSSRSPLRRLHPSPTASSSQHHTRSAVRLME